MALIWCIFFIKVAVILGQSCEQDTCPEGYGCHPREFQCYADPPAVPDGKLHAWIGKGPDLCERDPANATIDCDLFDMVADPIPVSHKRGDPDDEWCDEGVRVRCLTKDIQSLPAPTPANELRVISYNIFERMWFVTWDGQRERSCRIPRVLLENWSNVDAIAFQETFMGGCFASGTDIRKLLELHGFPYSTTTVDDPNDRFEPGGMFVASRWPILEEDQFVFKSFDDDTWDMLAAKGVSYAKIEKSVDGDTRQYHVMSTHYQAGGANGREVRINQTREWAEFFQAKNVPATDGVVFAGDFNIDYHNSDNTQLQTVLDILGAMTPPITSELIYTSWPAGNDVHEGNPESNKWLDYTVPSLNHGTLLNSTMEALIPVGDEYFTVCWCEQCVNLHKPEYVFPDDPDCDRTKTVQHLSDHQPALGTFIYE